MGKYLTLYITLKFIEVFLDCYIKKSSVSVHHATAAKPRKWYPKAFQANPNARWWFGIDGLPKESHKYRINQDGEKLFEYNGRSKLS